MNHYAFIFARGGSKGLPRKNVLPLAGKPLIHWSIDSAKATSLISRVFVSTEDPEIARLAKERGAEVIIRPMALAQDDSPEWLAWQHAVQWVEEKYGQFDTFISLPTTSPLRASEDIEGALQQLQKVGADICISTTPAGRSPFFNMVMRQQDETVQLVCETPSGVSRRQDAPSVYDITTVVYAARPAYIRQASGLLAGKVTSICVPAERAVDIDTQLDFDFAELLAKRMRKV
ncbi:cytidylyltransferase domain-containing protein [Pseudoalteromonas ruthenica]|uniref:Acylneuraminate cytidylyltransferase n=1 Tax=Pseudoalteromonas ruthenica TaxID=151081 RepID=A0A0F4PNZ1_9GAMM|nr:acylneuraminate cytidylyltransferase family protein [Pseudoalteromonas ruthenica]KJY97230.1 acylneuraminate cytidylyltransferase [Pseudoalteromonas ruthenica]KJY99543.1 acylneuraminate cytidylyltransferase [Pseudoalteromonas ruthenica]TMO93370.1 acylneuraminate cytidylyltransferase family protein [Pseudoalteromonas ruthenica]TMP00122.1 acylneuraminate cytidylyltransferase family protein [Pseudoalteromonas ruthenica]TMP06008.1 acylneuraminate cytidylyltransferase family protein [Pseudoaltero